MKILQLSLFVFFNILHHELNAPNIRLGSKRCDDYQELRLPGVKTGIRRRAYKRTNEENMRVIAAAFNDKDWKAVAASKEFKLLGCIKQCTPDNCIWIYSTLQ